jgi:hypothetical protein
MTTYTILKDIKDEDGRLAPKGTELFPADKSYSGSKDGIGDNKAYVQHYYKGYVEDFLIESPQKWVVQFTAEDVENTPDKFRKNE